jgi:hypothetical protein
MHILSTVNIYNYIYTYIYIYTSYYTYVVYVFSFANMHPDKLQKHDVIHGCFPGAWRVKE